jgi:CheY-like chemotaxis protein
VLVVDDDADIREALKDTLEQEGYPVACAGDGMEALLFLEANPVPALILLDWNMAPMNAEGFMEVFGKDPRFGSIPVVLVTADARVGDRASSYAGFLKKPVKLDTLLAIVARHCGPPEAG